MIYGNNMKCRWKIVVYGVPGHMVKAVDLTCDTCIEIPLIYVPERYGIYVKCGEHTCF